MIRSTELRSVPSAELVPGDLILIEEGDTIPADARVIQSTALQTAEAALTGESLPVSKSIAPIAAEAGLGDRENMVFSGTTATYGRGRAVVVMTGMRTEMGRIAGMLRDAPTETTPLQKELDRVGKLLGVIVVIIAVVMIATIFLTERVSGAFSNLRCIDSRCRSGGRGGSGRSACHRNSRPFLGSATYGGKKRNRAASLRRRNAGFGEHHCIR